MDKEIGVIVKRAKEEKFTWNEDEVKRAFIDRQRLADEVERLDKALEGWHEQYRRFAKVLEKLEEDR